MSHDDGNTKMPGCAFLPACERLSLQIFAGPREKGSHRPQKLQKKEGNLPF